MAGQPIELVHPTERRADAEEVGVAHIVQYKCRTQVRLRGYDLNEISTMFTSSGLSIRQVFGDFDGAPFDAASPRLILVGSKAR